MSSSAVEIEKADMRVAHDEEAESEANKTVLPSESKPEVVKYSLAWFGFDINEDGNQAPKLPYWELFLIFLSFGNIHFCADTFDINSLLFFNLL